MMGKEEASGTDNTGRIKSPAGGRQEFTPWSSVPGPSRIGSELSQRLTDPLITTDESSLPGNRDETSSSLEVFKDTAEKTTSCSGSKSDEPVSNLKESLERIESAISQGSHFEIPPDLENPNSSPLHPSMIRTASGSSPSTSPFFSRDIDLSSIVHGRNDLLTVPLNSDVNKMFNIVNSSLVTDFDKALKDQVSNTRDTDSLHTSDEDSLLNTSVEEAVEKDVSVASDLDSLETTQEPVSKVLAVPSTSRLNPEKDNTSSETDKNNDTSSSVITVQDIETCIPEEEVQNPSTTDSNSPDERLEEKDDSPIIIKKDENIQEITKKSKTPFFNFDSLIPSESTICPSTPTLNDFSTSSDLLGFSNVISTASISSFTELTDDSSSMIDIRDCVPPVSSTDLKAISVPNLGLDKALINNTQCPIDNSSSKGLTGLSSNIKFKVEKTDNTQATCSTASVSNSACVKEEKIPGSQDMQRSGKVLLENTDFNDDKIDLMCTLNIGTRFYQREASNDKTGDNKSDDSDDVIITGVQEAPRPKDTVVIISDDSSSPSVVEIIATPTELSPVLISDDGMDDDEVMTTFPDVSSGILEEGNSSKDVDVPRFGLVQQGTFSSENNVNSADCQNQGIVLGSDKVSASDKEEQENVLEEGNSNNQEQENDLLFEQENVSDEGNSLGGLEHGILPNSGENASVNEQQENVTNTALNPEEVNVVPDNSKEENDYALNSHVHEGEDSISGDDNSSDYQAHNVMLNFQPFNEPNHVSQGNGFVLANSHAIEEDNSSGLNNFLLNFGPLNAPNNVEQENVPESLNNHGSKEQENVSELVNNRDSGDQENGPEEGNAFSSEVQDVVANIEALVVPTNVEQDNVSEEVISHVGREGNVLHEGSSSSFQLQDTTVNLEALNPPSSVEQRNLENDSQNQAILSNSEGVNVPDIVGEENEPEETNPSDSFTQGLISNSEEVPMEGDCEEPYRTSSSSTQEKDIITVPVGGIDEQGIISNSGEVSTGVDREEQDYMSNSSGSQEDRIVTSSEGIIAPDCKELGIVSNSGEANASNPGVGEEVVSEGTNSSDSQEHRVVSNSEGVNASDNEEQGDGRNSEETNSSDSQENRIVSNSEGVSTFLQSEEPGNGDQEQEIVSSSGDCHTPDPEGQNNEIHSEETNSSDDLELEYDLNAGDVVTPDDKKQGDDSNGGQGTHNSEDDNTFDGEKKSNEDNGSQSQKQDGVKKAEKVNNSFDNQVTNRTKSDEPSSSVSNDQGNISTSEETNTLDVQEQGAATTNSEVDKNSVIQPQGNVSNQEDKENMTNSEEKPADSKLEEEGARCFGNVTFSKLDLKDQIEAEIIEESKDGGMSLDGENTNENSAPEVDLSAISDERPSMLHTLEDFNQNEDSTLSDHQVGKESNKLPCQDSCKHHMEEEQSENDINFENSSSNLRSNIDSIVSQSSFKDSYPLSVKVSSNEETSLEDRLDVDQSSEKSLNLYLDGNGQSTKSVDKDLQTSDVKDGYYSSPIPLDVIIDEGETVMSPFTVVSESSSTPAAFNVEEGACSEYRTFSAATTDNSGSDNSLVVSKVNIKIEEDVDIGSSILTIKVEDMDLDVISASKDMSNKYSSVSVDIGDSNVPLSSLLKKKKNLSRVDKKPLRSKITNIEQIADKLVAGGRFRPLAPKPLRDEVLESESYDQSGALLAAALGCGNIPKITSAVEILRVDSPKAIRKKPDLTPSVSLIPADVAHATPKSFSSNVSGSVSSISSLISGTSKDKGIPSQVLQLSNFKVELRNVQSNSQKSPYIQPTATVPQMLSSASLARLSSVQPQPSKGRSLLNIPSCYLPPPTIPQMIPRPRGRVPIEKIPSQHRYVEAFYRTKAGAIKKKFVKVPYSNSHGKLNRDVPNAAPQAIPETSSSSSPIMDILHLSNVDVIYSNPSSISPNSSNGTNIPTQLSSAASLHKQSERLKPTEIVRETLKSHRTDSKNDAQKVNFEFHSKEVGVPESILNILLHENNKTDNKTDSIKTDKRKDSIDKGTSLSSATPSLLKFPQNGASGSEEVVFNSNDLKVILVQPESDLHSSKKTSLIPLCENNDKPIASDKTEADQISTNTISSDRITKKDENSEITESIAPSKSPDIVLLTKSAAEQTKSSNPNRSDKALQILKVPQFGSDKEVPYDSQSFIPLYNLNTSKSDDTIKTTSSTDSPVQFLDQATPVDTSNQGGRSGMVSRKVLGKRKHDAEPVVKRRSRLSNVTPPPDTTSQPDESNKIILTNVGRGCGGEVSVNQLSQPGDAPLKIVDVDNSQKEKQDAIHRLRRLGTDVSLEEHKVTKSVSSGDTVLVTPVDDSEHQPPAIKLLEDMAKSTELPVSSPVLTALGQQTVRPKRKCHQYSSEVPKVQMPVDNHQNTSKSVNGDSTKMDEDKISAQGKSTNPVQIVESNVQIKLPSDDKAQKSDTASSGQKITRSFVQSSKNLQVVLVDKNSQNAPTEDKTKSEANEIKNSPESAITVDLDTVKIQKNDRFKISIMSKDPVEDENGMEITSEGNKEDEVEIPEAKCSSGVFLIRPQHYVKTVEDEQVWCCDICTVVCSQLQLFRKHYLRSHISPKFISERDKEMWNIVEDQSEEDKLFKCHVCKVHFDKKSDLKEHLEDHPKKDDSAVNKSPNQYVCPYCDAVFKWRKPFGKHKKTCLGNAKKSKKPTQHCLYCNETFFTPYRKNIHILSSHPYTRRKHPCVFCSIVFPSNIALFNHLVNQHSSHFHGCTTCKERFLNVNELKVHFKKFHPNENVKEKNPFNRAKEYFECSKCERVFLIESCLNKHECTRQPVEKEKTIRQKRIKPSLIERKIEGRRPTGETDFFSRVSNNIQDNLTYHLDGKLHPVEPPNYVAASHRTILNFNASVPSTSVTAPAKENVVVKSPNTPTYEKFSFPKEYDGRCGLTSFIKDASYLDISTQLIMRRNLQRLNLLSESTPDPHGDVPAVLALERLGAQCAESFGTAESAHEDEVDESDDQLPVRNVGELSGEWVRERTYVCSTCLWQTSCLWNMEDHKYTAHPHVWTPQHELNTPNHKHMASFAYRRLVDSADSTKEEKRDRGSITKREKFECTKCGVNDIKTKNDLHRHIVECSGEDLVALETLHNAAVVRLPTTKRRPKWRGGGRRTRQGLKRNIPTTPPAHNSKRNRKLLRTKPGDADTIEKMIANLPAKRATRRVLGFDEIDIKTRSQATIQNNPVPITTHEHIKKPTKDKMSPPKKLEKKIQGIDTSAENGNVLSSLRMMPVKKLDLEMNDSLPPRLEMEAPMVPGNVNKEIPILTPATTSVSTCNSRVLPIKSHVISPSKTAIFLLVPPIQEPPPLVPIVKEDKDKLKSSESRLNLLKDVNVADNKLKNDIVHEKEETPKPQTTSKTPETPQIKLRSKIDPIRKRGRPAGSKNKASINQVKKEDMKKKVTTKKVQTWCLKEHVKEAKNSAGRTLKGWLIKDLDQKGQNLTNVKMQKDIKKKQPLKKNSKQKQISVKITPKHDENKIGEKSSEVEEIVDTIERENKTSAKSPENSKVGKNNDVKAAVKNTDVVKPALKNIDGAKGEVKNTDGVKTTMKNNDGGKTTAKNTDVKTSKSTPTSKNTESVKSAVKNTNIPPAKVMKKAESDKAAGKSTEVDKTSGDCLSTGKTAVKNTNSDKVVVKAADDGKSKVKNAESGKAAITIDESDKTTVNSPIGKITGKNAEGGKTAMKKAVSDKTAVKSIDNVITTAVTPGTSKAALKSVQGGKTVAKSLESAGKPIEGGKATPKGRASLRSLDGDKTLVKSPGRGRASRSALKSLEVSKYDEIEASVDIADVSENLDDSALDKSINKDSSATESNKNSSDQQGVAGNSKTELDEGLKKENSTSPKGQDSFRKGRKRKSDTPEEEKIKEDQIEEEKRRKIELQKQREETRLKKQAERKRLIEERQKKREELKKLKEEEKKKKEEAKRLAAEEEKKRKEEEEERKRKEMEEARLKQEEEARLKQEEEARLKQEEEAKLKQEKEKKRLEEELRKKKEEEENKRLKELEKKKQEEEKRKQKEEEEKKRKEQEEEKRRKAQEEEKRRKEQEEEKRRKEQEEEKKRKEQEEEKKRKEQEEEKKRKEEEEKRKKKEEEEERKRKEQEEKRRRKEEEDRRCKEEEEMKKLKEEEEKKRKKQLEEDNKRREQEKRQKEEEEKKHKEEELKRKEEEEKQRREEQERILQLEQLEAEETKSLRGDSDVGSVGEMSPHLCDSEDAKLSDTDSQKSFRLKLKRKCGQKKDVLLKFNRMTLAQKIRKKKMLKKIKESGTISGKEVVSSGTKWSVEVSKEESAPSSHGQSVDMVDWLSDMPLSTPPVLKPVPNSVLLSEPISSSSGAHLNVQHSSVTSSSAPITADPMWRDSAGYQSTSTNLGSILDSVNNLLNEDLTMYSSPLMQQSLGPQQYSLADLQRAMGASDAEMAVLQQLGEIKPEEHKEEDWSEVNIMDLDKQNSGVNFKNQSGNSSAVPAPGVANVNCPSAGFNEAGGSTSWDPISRPSVSYQSPNNCIAPHYSTSTMNMLQKSVDNKKPNCTLATRRKDASSALLAAHPGKEVVCPTCSCHFVGFPALQLHISKYHPTRETTGHLTALEAKVAGVRRMSANMCHKQDLSMLNKRALLESAKGCRLVCFMCQQILPSNLMSAHLVVEHLAKPIEITKCQVITDPISNEPASDGGDNLKNKMTSALGDLLDRAVNNLLTAKQEGQSRMSGSAIQLLNKLSALRKREESQQRTQPTEKDLLLKVYAKNKLQAALKKGLNKNIKPANYTCGICGETFLWESTWSKHVLDVHTRLCGMPNVDELTSDPDDPEEDDWRTESGDDIDTVPSADGRPAQANAPSQIVPICSDCGLGFESMSELIAHRNELHKRPQRRCSTNSLPGASQVSSHASSAATSRCTTPVPSVACSQPTTSSSTITTTNPSSSSPPPSLQSATLHQGTSKDVVSNLPPPSISPAPIDIPPTIVPEAPPTRLTRSSASYFNPPTPPPPVLTAEGEVKIDQSEVKEEVKEVKVVKEVKEVKLVKEVKEVVKPISKTKAPVRRRGRSSIKVEPVPEPTEIVTTGRRSTRLDSASSNDSNTNSSGRRSSVRLEVKPSDSVSSRKTKNSTPTETTSNRKSSLKTTEIQPSSSDNSPSRSSGSTPSSSDTKKRQRKRLSSSPSSESRPKRMISSNDDEAVRKKAEVALRELNLSYKSKKGHSMSASNTSVRWRSAMTFSPKPKAESADAVKDSSKATSSAPTVYDFVDDQSS